MNRRHLASLVSGAVAVAIVALAPRAHAIPEFPEEIQRILDMSCAPPCTLCHTDSNGGIATITKPFGNAIFPAGGLNINDLGSVGPALDYLEGKAGSGGAGGSAGAAGSAGGASDAGSADAATDAAGGTGGSGGSGGGAVVDSDEDGMGDVEELRNGRDPNVAGAKDICGPTYGCGARVAPRGRIDGLALGAALAVAGALLISMRRRR
jgi:hypothetical protein